MPDDLDVELLSICESRIQRDGNLFNDACLPDDVGDGSRFYIVEFFHLRFSLKASMYRKPILFRGNGKNGIEPQKDRPGS